MADGTGGADVGRSGIGGPAAIAVALRALDRHARTIVKLAIAQQGIDGDLAVGVAERHDQVAHVLHELSLEHGTDAMVAAAEYAETALEAGSLYPGDELDEFLRSVAAAARATSRDLTKSTPFGS